MATDYPTALDSFTNPDANDNLDTTGVDHDEQHANANDAIEALQAKVGINSSANVNSIDYKLARVGYEKLILQSVAFSPADSTTYYWGADIGAGMATVHDNAHIYIPRAGTLKSWWFKLRITGTLGTAETVSHYLRLNDTTDFGQSDTTYDAATRNLVVTGLSQAVAAGDGIAVKVVTPAWVTNPTQVTMFGGIYIE
jgi:4-hydroxyphenylpyruvate dioxygenase-like putative hemolysin